MHTVLLTILILSLLSFNEYGYGYQLLKIYRPLTKIHYVSVIRDRGLVGNFLSSGMAGMIEHRVYRQDCAIIFSIHTAGSAALVFRA